LIAVPVMFAVVSYEIVKMGGAFTLQETVHFFVGFVVSFVVALLAIKTFLILLNRWTLVPFAWYRIVMAPVFYFLTR
jgi:undecaprenyl-diphosphatase